MKKEDSQCHPYRSRIEIIADILSLLRLGKTGKTQISYYAHLRWDQGTRYVEDLISKGLIKSAEEEMGFPSYSITKKGLETLRTIENIKQILPPDSKLDILHNTKVVTISPGKIFVTQGVAKLAMQNSGFASHVQKTLQRYCRGEWDVTGEDVGTLKRLSLEHNWRISASYESEKFPEIWITTEPNRSSTTIMFAEEDINIEQLEQYWAEEDILQTS